VITVAIEDMMADTIVSFCENAAQLGCPRNKDVDMWFRELSRDERYEVMSKLICIEESFEKESIEQQDEIESCGCNCACGKNCKCKNDCKNDNEKNEDNEKVTTMHQITIDIENDLLEVMINFARSKIVNDRDALINYGVNYALKDIIKMNEV